MKTRVITAVVALAAFIPVLVFSDTAVFPVVLSLLSAIAGFEVTTAVIKEKGKTVAVFNGFWCFIVPFTLGLWERPFNTWDAEGYFVFVAAYLFTAMCLCVFLFGKISSKDVMASVAMGLFVLTSFYSIILIRQLTPYLYLLAFVCAWTTDTAAIFGGKFFGKHKLAPNLSPKKTVEGAVSGIIGCVIGVAVYALAVDFGFGQQVNYIKLILLAIPASIVSQVGDLAASAIKRDCGIKDYGKLFPGHGGVMDRFDSVLFVSLGCMLYIYLNPIIM